MIQNIIDNLEMMIIATIFVLILALLFSTILLCMDGPTFHTKQFTSKFMLVVSALIVILAIIGCFL